jgi:hypothetical protein
MASNGDVHTQLPRRMAEALAQIKNMPGAPGGYEAANQLLDAIGETLDDWVISTPTEELEYTEQAQVVKDWSDKTEIIRYFAHQTKSRELERKASVIRCRLMIRLGELPIGLKEVGTESCLFDPSRGKSD